MADTDEFGGVQTLSAGDEFGGVAVADAPPRRPFLQDLQDEEPDLSAALSTEPISPGRIAQPDIGHAGRRAIGTMLAAPLKPAVDLTKAASLGKQIQYVAGMPGRWSPEDEPSWTASKIEDLNRVLFPGGRTEATEWLAPETIPDNLRAVLHGQFMQEVGKPYPARPERTDEFGGVEAPNQVLAGVGGAVEGLEKTGLGALSFITSPAGAALPLAGALPPLAQGAISGGFAVDMGRSALEGSKEFKRAVESGDVVGASRAAAETIAGGAMAAVAGGHAIGKTGEAIARSRGAESRDVATEATSEKPSQTSLQSREPESPPIEITADAMTELQSAMRGNQVKGTFAQEPKAPAPVTAPPGGSVTRPGPTEEQRAAIEFQRKTDAAVQRELENPDKKYDGMSSLDLELLEGMGDAGAIAERRRRRRLKSEAENFNPPAPVKETRQPEPAVPLSEPSAAAETITGRKEAAVEAGKPAAATFDKDERTGSEMPAEAVQPVPPPLTAPKTPRKRIDMDRPWDIIDEIESQVGGKIDPKLIREANPDWKPVGAARRLFRTDGRAADQVLHGITYEGPKLGLRDDTGMQEFGEAINAAATVRQGWKGQAKAERELNDAQAREYETRRQFENKVLEGERPKRGPAVQTVPIDGLVEGDKFKVQDHTFEVQAIEFDPDNDGRVSSVTLKDGPKFGVQTVEGREVIHIDEGTMRRNRKARQQAAEFAPDTDTIEAALDKLKIDVKPDQLHAFGLLPEIWNGLVETVRLAYRGGKSIKEAIEHGLEWLRATHGDQKFDEPSVRGELEKQLEASSIEGQFDKKADLPIRQKLEVLESEMRGHEAKGEVIPQATLDRYKELADELGEAIRTGKEPLNKGGGTLDSNLTKAEKPSRTSPPSREPAMPAFKGKDKLPSADLRDALSGLENVRHSLASWWKGGAVRRSITYLKDALETRADNFGKQASNHVRLMLNRAFEVAPKDVRRRNDLREFALSFAVEANREQSKLADWHELIGGSEFSDTTWGRRAIRALEYANEHWDRLAPVVEEYRRLSEAEREAELNAGQNVGEWRGTGYVRHVVEGMAPEVSGGAMGPQAAGRQYTRKRSFPTLAEHIAGGNKPQLNALDLLSGRLADGQKAINETAWLEGMNTMIDPLTQEPITQSVEWKPKRPIQTQGAPAGRGESFEDAVPAEWEPHAPSGYHVVKFGPTTFALHNDYGGLFKDLTSESWLRSGSVGRALTNTVAAMKHTTLLFDTFHLGRLAFWRTVLGGVGEGAGPGFRKGSTLADYTSGDIMQMIQRGEVPESMGRNLLENKRTLDLLLQHGFNIGRVMDNAHLSGVLGTLRESGIPGVSHAANGLGGFNEWLFGQYQRGAMVESGLIEFNRIKKARPEMNDAQVARQVATDLNVRFGNLGRQGLFRSKTGQDLARLVFLAPQWNESLIRSELGSLRQLGQVPIDIAKGRGLMAGTLLKATGTMILGQFAANQLLNYATRGQPTWKNPEEGFASKISAWIPDVVGNGPGFFLNPLAIAAEYAHLIESKLHQTGGESDEAIRRILNSRLSGVGRAGMTFLTRKDEIGRTLRGNEVWQGMGRALLPVPIGAGAIGAAGKQVLTGEPSEGYAGQFQKQLMSSAGIKSDQAPGPEQRVRALARDFNKARGILPSAEFYAGDFQPFTDALRRGNQSDAREALEELLTKKTPKQVAEHYSRWIASPFTGQRARESEFWRGLDEEQRGQYVTARETRKALARQAVEMVRGRVAVAR